MLPLYQNQKLSTMGVLIIIFVTFTIILVLFTYISRRGKEEETDVSMNKDSDCCGVHEVCDRDNLQIIDTDAHYFDDEELDILANKKSDDYSQEEIKMVEDVFYTLKESDVAKWLKNMQLRNIELPDYIKEQALLIVQERRFG